MIDATPEQKALARKIAQRISKNAHGFYSNEVYIGALAAIIETTERAAKFIEQFGNADTIGSYGDAEALRNQEHLK